jgi:hypothetical protein
MFKCTYISIHVGDRNVKCDIETSEDSTHYIHKHLFVYKNIKYIMCIYICMLTYSYVNNIGDRNTTWDIETSVDLTHYVKLQGGQVLHVTYLYVYIYIYVYVYI